MLCDADRRFVGEELIDAKRCAILIGAALAPGLAVRLILGHWGEVVLFYLDRTDMLTDVAKLPRPVSTHFRSNMWATPSSLLSDRYLRWAIEVMGVERLVRDRLSVRDGQGWRGAALLGKRTASSLRARKSCFGQLGGLARRNPALSAIVHTIA